MINLLLSILSNFWFLALHVINNSSFPKQLSKDEEEKLIKQMENGDDNARKKLIEHNLRLVSHVCKKYYSKFNDTDELISIGTIGLVKGVNSFQSSKSTKLSTYLAKCIQNEILMFFRAQKKSAQDVYFEDQIDTDSDGNALTLMDIISVEDNIADELSTKFQLEKLNQLVQNIKDPREKEIIVLRYGLFGNEELTQREIAKKLGISRSYVSRIEKKVIDDLRDKL